MTLAELTSSVEFIVDEAGQEKVILNRQLWDEIVAALEEVEADGDRRWEELFADPRSPELLERLAGEARADRKAGRTRELDPDSL